MEQPGPEVEYLVSFVKELKPQNVLEVGCNFGRELKKIEKLSEVWGIDKDPDKILEAKENIKSGSFCVMQADDLKFEDGKFDLVYSDGCISHCRTGLVPIILDEMVRVSRKYVLLIEWIGSKTGLSTIGNCKQNSNIHDYEFLWLFKGVDIKFNRKVQLGSDFFHVILVEKKNFNQKNAVLIKETPQKEKEIFKIKIWKWLFKVEKD